MSQIFFKTTYLGKNCEVMTGWDPPLGFYHLTIFDPNASDDADTDVLWDGLDRLGFCRDIKNIEKAFQNLNINPPDEIYTLIDKKEGNVFYKWDSNQWVKY
jgi:hypothetical protein